MGGVSQSTGVVVSWQNGPLGRGDVREEPNGAFVETVVKIALDRLEFYQAGKFACHENDIAIARLREAISALNERTKHREKREVEGTYQV
ncbi:MAG: hypothetical protein WBB28_01225 [Crinalium sp.]